MTPDDVPSGPVIFDTDVASWVRSGRHRGDEFRHLLAGHAPILTFVTVAELLAGAHDARWGAVNRPKLLDWMRGKVVIGATTAVVERWADLAAALRGAPLKGGGVNDMWLAACALAQEPALPVATNNLADFLKIQAATGLVLIHPDL